VQADPSLSADDVEALLERTGKPVTDPRSGGVVPRIDVAAALSAALGRPIPLLPASPTESGPASVPTPSAPTVPRIELAPGPIAFGAVRVGQSARRSLVLRDAGKGYLTARVAPPASPFAARPAKVVLAPGASASVTLTFRPRRSGEYAVRLVLRTDDPSAPTISIPVRGRAIRP
jgi:hypothetical protein